MTEAIIRSFSSFGFGRCFQNLKTWRIKHKMFVKTRDELEKLNDRELADMGIHRCEIGRIAKEHAEKIAVNENLKGWV